MDVKELESKTVAQLKEMAKEAGISGISSMKKADLVAAITGAAGTSPAEAPESTPAPVPEEEAPAAEEVPAEEAAPEEAPAAEEAPAEEAAPEEAPAAEEAPAEEAAPEEAPAVEETPAAAAAPVKKAEPAPEPPKPEAGPTKTQLRLREKYDLPALKVEKKALRSKILTAIADQDYAKLKELRNRKKELRRLLNRAG